MMVYRLHFQAWEDGWWLGKNNFITVPYEDEEGIYLIGTEQGLHL